MWYTGENDAGPESRRVAFATRCMLFVLRLLLQTGALLVPLLEHVRFCSLMAGAQAAPNIISATCTVQNCVSTLKGTS
jgi:hypothetical protein